MHDLKSIFDYIANPVDRNMVDSCRLLNLHSLFWTTLLLNVPGDAVELGCYTGTSGVLIAMTLEVSKSRKKLHLFDSFEGLPHLSVHDNGSIGTAAPGTFHTSREVLESNFNQRGLRMPVIHQGWFRDTLPDRLPEQICFAHLDGDIHESIEESLRFIYPRLSRGGIIVVDDYDTSESACFPGCAKAVDEFLKDRAENVVPFSSKESYVYSCQGIIVKA